MKIAILHLTMGLVDRGSEISTDLIASYLSQKHDVYVFQAGQVTAKPYQVISIPLIQSPPNPAPRHLLDKLLFRLQLDKNSLLVRKFTNLALKKLISLKPDVIIATNGPQQLKILRHARLSSKLVVFGRAGIGFHDARSLKLSPDLFIALSQKAYSWAKQINPNIKITYIPNPIDVNRFSQAKPISPSLSRPIVLTVGALTAYKNITPVVQAVAQTSFSHLIIGSGEQENTVKSLATKLLPNRHEILSHIPPHQLPSYYQAADIFCFVPQPQEAFGRVYLEAMSAGLPIVATDDEIRREIIGSKGFFANPNDLNDLVAKLTQAQKLDKPVSYTNQLKPYTIEIVGQQIEKAFHELIQN